MVKLSTAMVVALLSLVVFITPSLAVSSCNGPCNTLDDCEGQLTCIYGKCNDDPDMGTHICPSGGGGGDIVPLTPPSGGGCESSGTLHCGIKSYPQYTCSPPVTASTRAILTNNDFSEGGDGGAKPDCYHRYYDNSEMIVALSTGWYSGRSRCGRMIKIMSMKTQRSVQAEVVDECDSVNGCDSDHAGQAPCRNNIVDGSNGVWEALGLNINVGEEDVCWTMA